MVNDWNEVDVDVFWGEIAPSEHVVQIYENDGIFLDSLSGFVGGGIKSNDCVIVIATEEHLVALEQRLEDYGISVTTLVDDDRYIPLNADKVLSSFMIDGWPNEELFVHTISSVIQKAIVKKRRVRAFGEMVAILWSKGMNGATVTLEHLWNNFCRHNQLSLFCAYPKSGFTQNPSESMQEICGCHAKMINGERYQLSSISYINT